VVTDELADFPADPVDREPARPGRVRPAYHRVADELRSRIVAGALACGERLPNETDLGRSFGVSRSTVREALRVLASQHLVTTLRGVHGGSFVTEPDPASVIRDLGGALGALALTPTLGVEDLAEARLLVEPTAARRAAERGDPGAVRAITAAAKVEPNPDDGHRAHLDFHAAVLAGAGNILFSLLITPVLEVLRSRMARAPITRAELNEVHGCHQHIAAHIARGEAVQAEEAMRLHLVELAPFYRRALWIG
jgi:DNA-binding FadR family transcriptional regulator